MKVFLLGYPGGMGGANTEAWHTIKLLRSRGVEVHLIPTWGKDDAWKARLDAIGCVTHHIKKDGLENFKPLHGAVVIGMCNQNVYHSWTRLKRMGCKVIWINCMTFMFPAEKANFSAHGMPAAFIFQSAFQRDELERSLRGTSYKPEIGHLIRGAFDFEEYPYHYEARTADDPFVVGRLSRPAPDKWPKDLWNIYSAINHPKRQALVMGVDDLTRAKIGPAPSWGKALKPQEMPVQDYLRRIHCLVTTNGTARENWPRVGLEAMAAGVPLVVPRQWGWKEMVKHGETGFLADNHDELSGYATILANNEGLRRSMAEAGRAWVEELANPDTIWAGWERILTELNQG
jgi:glycosyltransferase involved in cell wall biosynthesis